LLSYFDLVTFVGQPSAGEIYFGLVVGTLGKYMSRTDVQITEINWSNTQSREDKNSQQR